MLWHPAKFWRQFLTSSTLIDRTGTCDLESPPGVVVWPARGSPQLLSNPPGQLDSGQYMWDLSSDPPVPLPFYYQCLTCCCTPAKCGIPQEILMTLSGFDGILSSVDRPAAFGYAPTTSCPECNIMWTGDCDTQPGHRFTGYNEACCKCRKRLQFQWWSCRSDSVSLVPVNVCDAFPYLCSGGPTGGESIDGRIAARYINPCVSYFNGTSPCTDFVWSDYDRPGFTDYSVVELTDCANAPEANARRDYNCITRERIDFVRENDSYLPPPGFRGPGAVNLLPLNGPFCSDKFWNDTTFYRFCVGTNAAGNRGNFWCQGPCHVNHCYCGGGWWRLDEDFFWNLDRGKLRGATSDEWKRTNDWCQNAPKRCSGPIPVDEVNWTYRRPDKVLISQPSKQNCMMCPGYGFGYGSDGSNYGHGQDWYDPYDDGNCIGKTDVHMADFNQTFMMYAAGPEGVTGEPPYLKPVVRRSRNIPPGETKLIDAVLLFQLKQYAQNEGYCSCFQYRQGYWNLDYPCEPKSYDFACECVICAFDYGTVAPKLRAYYTGQTGEDGNTQQSGGDAVIKYTVRPYCSQLGLGGTGVHWQGSGSNQVAGLWYVASVSVDENQRGADYRVGDEFVFNFYEIPVRGGEYIIGSGRYPGPLQRAKVTKVGDDGEILEIVLVLDEDTPDLYTACANGSRNPLLFTPWVPLYGRFLPHRQDTAIPGNGYIEGDIIEFENIGAPPQMPLPTGHRYYPYVRTDSRYRSLAKATVMEVDNRGGIKEWHMCGAKQKAWVAPGEPTCTEDHTGIYYSDYQYTNRCEYNYVGYLPVKYTWSGWFDYHFHKETYCGYAWAKFTFKLDQISIKNTVTVGAPLRVLDAPVKKPQLRISQVQPMVLYGQTIEPMRYQNWEMSPGPNARTTRLSDGNGNYRWYKDHDFPSEVQQGAVLEIEVVDPGAGYVKKMTRPDGSTYWEPLIVSTQNNADVKIYVQGVTDDIRDYAQACWGWPAHCKCKANIIMDEDSPNFGGIESIDILPGDENNQGTGGLWYFVNSKDSEHVWLAKAGSDWYFEFADPLSEENPNPRNADYDNINGADCWHASRDNWGELHHKAGFYEPYPSGYVEGQRILTPEQIPSGPIPESYVFKFYNCGLISDENVQWPKNPRSMGGGGVQPVEEAAGRWSANFCPTELLNKQFSMLLVHPCAACAKELNMSGAQTCWNMRGFGDTTYAMYPNQWAGTGTAMIDALGGALTMTTSLPET